MLANFIWYDCCISYSLIVLFLLNSWLKEPLVYQIKTIRAFAVDSYNVIIYIMYIIYYVLLYIILIIRREQTYVGLIIVLMYINYNININIHLNCA